MIIIIIIIILSLLILLFLFGGKHLRGPRELYHSRQASPDVRKRCSARNQSLDPPEKLGSRLPWGASLSPPCPLPVPSLSPLCPLLILSVPCLFPLCPFLSTPCPPCPLSVPSLFPMFSFSLSLSPPCLLQHTARHADSVVCLRGVSTVCRQPLKQGDLGKCLLSSDPTSDLKVK